NVPRTVVGVPGGADRARRIERQRLGGGAVGLGAGAVVVEVVGVGDSGPPLEVMDDDKRIVSGAGTGAAVAAQRKGTSERVRTILRGSPPSSFQVRNPPRG